ncbi:MAG: hypothetical protein QOE53_1464, partial [Pseudonocardiales bacterium]|nr:hypothetical protein [Pseudonocardiales bacterium]
MRGPWPLTVEQLPAHGLPRGRLAVSESIRVLVVQAGGMM